MAFNFNLNEVQVASTTNYLKPYDIYDNVGIDGVEFKSGTSQAGNDWKCLRITFKCDKGIYTESLFIPDANNEKDVTRQEYDMPNGGKKPYPSRAEKFMAMVAAIGSNFNPEGYAKLQKASTQFKSFDDVAKGLAAILSKGTVTTSMKLMGRTSQDGKVYACLPKPLAMTQDKDSNEWRAFALPMFGNDLQFSTYEMKEVDKYHSAKATKVGDDSIETDPVNNFDAPAGSDIVDFNAFDI